MPAPSPSTKPAPVQSEPLHAATRDDAGRWVDSVLASMTLREKAAQLVWPQIFGEYTAENAPNWLRIQRLVTEQKVGGFIMSVGSPLDIATRINALQRASKLPLLFGADFETGAGFRVRAGYFVPNAIDLGGATVLPLQMALGAADDTALAYEAGRVTAREGRALGLHLSFGPVLDVNNNPANPVIGARSFGEDPKLAARLGAAFVRGVQDNGMLATGKHFPGHGDTETNSHLALSEVRASRARLDTVELVPFRAAIDAGVGAIMTYHGILPALDSSGVPATLSPLVLTGLLRQSMHYTGLLITDAMDMAGVVAQFGAQESAKRAIAAGADVLLMPADVAGTIDAVVAGVREGRYDAARLDASVRHVLRLKRMFSLDRNRFVSLDSVRIIVG
jgi:beta-N-acetylhexosaminidase